MVPEVTEDLVAVLVDSVVAQEDLEVDRVVLEVVLHLAATVPPLPHLLATVLQLVHPDHLPLMEHQVVDLEDLVDLVVAQEDSAVVQEDLVAVPEVLEVVHPPAAMVLHLDLHLTTALLQNPLVAMELHQAALAVPAAPVVSEGVQVGSVAVPAPEDIAEASLLHRMAHQHRPDHLVHTEHLLNHLRLLTEHHLPVAVVSAAAVVLAAAVEQADILAEVDIPVVVPVADILVAQAVVTLAVVPEVVDILAAAAAVVDLEVGLQVVTQVANRPPATVHPLVHRPVTERLLRAAVLVAAQAVAVSVAVNLLHPTVHLPDHQPHMALLERAVVDSAEVLRQEVTEPHPADSAHLVSVVEAAAVASHHPLTARRLGHLLATGLLRLEAVSVEDLEVVSAEDLGVDPVVVVPEAATVEAGLRLLMALQAQVHHSHMARHLPEADKNTRATADTSTK